MLELVSPANAGSITGTTMAIERQDQIGDDQYLLRVVTKNRDGSYVLVANNPDYEDLHVTPELASELTVIATRATPDDERDYGVEDGGGRSRNILAARPRKLT